MINRLFKWLFSFTRPVIRCKRCNRPLRNEYSRLTGYSEECWRKTVAEYKAERERLLITASVQDEITKNMEEIAKEQGVVG